MWNVKHPNRRKEFSYRKENNGTEYDAKYNMEFENLTILIFTFQSNHLKTKMSEANIGLAYLECLGIKDIIRTKIYFLLLELSSFQRFFMAFKYVEEVKLV